MHYVYILNSVKFQKQIYIGQTNELQKRLSNHNSGYSPHTSKYKLWKVIAYFAFECKNKAIKFEKFLKSGSGREFISKRIK